MKTQMDSAAAQQQPAETVAESTSDPAATVTDQQNTQPTDAAAEKT